MASQKQVLANFLCMLIASSIVSACGQDPTYFKSLDDYGGPAPKIAADAAPEYLKTFQAGELASASLSIPTGFNLIQQDFTLEQAPKSVEINQQIDRTRFEENFTQGHSGLEHEESFSISEAGIFDLLIVMDNSSSMGPYQNRMSNNLPSILKYISNTNWRIAVVTTTNACLSKTQDGRRFITRADYDADPAKTTSDFQNLIKIGEGGDPVEKGIKTATEALLGIGCPQGNNTWLRADSQRSVLIVTDEDNCGSASNEGCIGSPYESADYFFSQIGYNVPVNALLLQKDPPTPNRNDPLDPAHDCVNSGSYLEPPNPVEYERLVKETGGLSSDVCRSDYQKILEQISMNVRKKINIQYELTFPAVASSLELELDKQKIQQYSVNNRTLTILQNVNDHAKTLSVKYKHDPVDMIKELSPSHPLDEKTIEVLVNDEALPKGHYRFDQQSQKIVLNNFPPEHASIKLKYRDAINLRKEFSYAAEIVEGSLEVWVDDKKVEAFEHDQRGKKLDFVEAPADGSTISIRYELPGDRRLKYPILGADAEKIENLRIIDLETKEELLAVQNGAELEFDHDSISADRKVRAIYNMNYDFAAKEYSLAIEKPPFPGSLSISVGGDETLCGQNLKIQQDKISFACSDEDFESVDVSYKYANDYSNSFNIAVNYSGLKNYHIYVNNQEISDFEIIEETLVIPKRSLPPGATVKVHIKPKTLENDSKE